MIRKIASHYYLNASGEFDKYPIISIENGVVTDISLFDVLPEIAGLEFYSGVLLPLFVDVIFPISLTELLLYRSFLSSLISKVVISNDLLANDLAQLPPLQKERVLIANDGAFLQFNGLNDENLSIFKKIDRLVDSKIFSSQIAGINYFTNVISKNLNIDSYSRICVGAKAEFILCNDLNLVKLGRADEAKFRRLI